RVARLKALKDASGVVARGEALPDDILATLMVKPQDRIRTRPSPVPQISRQHGRWNSSNLEILSLLNTQSGRPVVSGPEAECEACPRSLNT
ncbi:hypothetical protein, partial [Klebsiella pneumoniae]